MINSLLIYQHSGNRNQMRIVPLETPTLILFLQKENVTIISKKNPYVKHTFLVGMGDVLRMDSGVWDEWNFYYEVRHNAPDEKVELWFQLVYDLEEENIVESGDEDSNDTLPACTGSVGASGLC